ncbi:MAG: o-succinylbenzoate--CoA ligase [Deltaproteobacteria bacterium]|nr:o-succinylbenzoate--CoA ligase [Deltaproteobacteria bacterium]
MNLPLTPIRFLERTLKLFGEKTGVICEEKRFTYREYGQRVFQLANALSDQGIGKGDIVGYLGYNCHRLLEAYYGVPMIGAVLMSLNIRLSIKDFLYILKESEPKILFLDKDFLTHIDQIRSQIRSIKKYILLDAEEGPPWVVGGYEKLLASYSSAPPYPAGKYPFHEDDMAELFYTSGTTGEPKGVMLSHRNLYLHALTCLTTMTISDADTVVHLVPLFHVNGWGLPHYLTAKGGTHIMMKKFDPLNTLEIIQRERVTKLYIVPIMVNAILDHPKVKEFDVSSIKEVDIGGAPPPSGMFERFQKIFTQSTAFSAFGMTETCPAITFPELDPKLPKETLRYRAWKTWGFPMLGVEIKIVDKEGKDLPWDGESVGELLVRGDMVMKGYFKKPADSEKIMAGGWFHTGDLCAIGPDGSLFVKDREKDIIISGGENISSLEIEQVLYSHPAIFECAVVGKPDPKWGEIPKAYVVLKEGTVLTGEQIVQFTRQNIAHFKALREAEIVKEMPRGGTNKILKQELRKRAREEAAPK